MTTKTPHASFKTHMCSHCWECKKTMQSEPREEKVHSFIDSVEGKYLQEKEIIICSKNCNQVQGGSIAFTQILRGHPAKMTNIILPYSKYYYFFK